MTSEDVVGKRVLYHGSFREHRGVEMVVEKAVTADTNPWLRDGETRYLLVYGPKRHEYLVNVRRESFTVLDDEEGHA